MKTLPVVSRVSLVLSSVFALLSFGNSPVLGLGSDADTLLLLDFENNATGAAGETPGTNTGVTFAAGVAGQGASLANPAQLYYPVASNFDPQRGSLEFWMKPSWAGNDGQGHTVLRQGSGGGVLFAKDGANNLRAIFRRFSVGGPELGVAFNVGSWLANEWHHVAFNWGDGKLQLFTDGTLRGETAIGALPTVAASTFQIGADGTGTYAAAVLDELRISNRPRTAAEIQADFASDIPGVTSLTITPASATIWPTWTYSPVVQAATALGTITVPPLSITWTNPAPTVVQIDSQGRVLGVAGGTAALTANFGGQSAPLAMTVRTPALPPEDMAIPPDLATPMPNALYDMPVVVLSYLPTNDGIAMDIAESGGEGGLNAVAAAKAKILTMIRQCKFSLEEASRFRGYKTPAARPSLGYRILKHLVVYEPIPPGKSAGGNANFGDYNQILARFGASQWVTIQNAKEIWLWGYHTARIVPVESNMASPTTGDISNSNRFADDMPIFDRTYVLYNYNYGRSQNEAVHNHGHQLEAMFSYVCQRQDGNDSLFWDKFCGRSGGVFQKGRCGNTHFPPNANADYDYNNTTAVLSDCEDWTPENTGVKMLTSATTWGSLSYSWPVVPGGLTEAQYYIYWMQNMPGHQNGIRNGNHVMRNWWEFVADWDAAYRKNAGLHKGPEASAKPLGFNPGTGRFRVQFGGDAGFAYAIEQSGDLATWSPAVLGAAFPGELIYEDPTGTAPLAPRFYRARLSP
jgi:hypothetical protein